jgi:DNA-directed RNA polymerase subunit N
VIIPVRCFTCGRVIGSFYPKFKEMLGKGVEPKEALDKLGVDRYCCRRMLLSHIDLIGETGKY